MTAAMNDLIQDFFEIFETRRSLFDIDIKSVADIWEKYNVYLSFRQRSKSTAVSHKVTTADRYIIHHWRKKETDGQNKVVYPIARSTLHWHIPCERCILTVHKGHVRSRRVKESLRTSRSRGLSVKETTLWQKGSSRVLSAERGYWIWSHPIWIWNPKRRLKASWSLGQSRDGVTDRTSSIYAAYFLLRHGSVNQWHSSDSRAMIEDQRRWTLLM